MPLHANLAWTLECDNCTRTVGWSGKGGLPEGWALVMRGNESLAFCTLECESIYCRQESREMITIPWSGTGTIETEETGGNERVVSLNISAVIGGNDGKG